MFNAVVYIDFTLDQAATLHLDLSDLKNSNGPGLNSAWWQLILNGPTTLGGELSGQKSQPYSGDVAFKGVNDVADPLHGQQTGSSYVIVCQLCRKRMHSPWEFADRDPRHQ